MTAAELLEWKAALERQLTYERRADEYNTTRPCTIAIWDGQTLSQCGRPCRSGTCVLCLEGEIEQHDWAGRRD